MYVEPKDDNDSKDDEHRQHFCFLLIDSVDSDMFALQIVRLAERLQSLLQCVLHAGVTFDNAVAVAVVVFQKYSVLFEAVMVINAPHRLPPAIQPNGSDMLALQAELSAESLQRLAERIKDIAAV